MNRALGHLCAHIGLIGPGEPPEDGEMIEMTLIKLLSIVFKSRYTFQVNYFKLFVPYLDPVCLGLLICCVWSGLQLLCC